MAELQLTAGNYEHAAFCFEELILSDPMSYLFHCRLAEVRYVHACVHACIPIDCQCTLITVLYYYTPIPCNTYYTMLYGIKRYDRAAVQY